MPAELQLFTSAEVAQILKMNGQVVTRKLQAGEIDIIEARPIRRVQRQRMRPPPSHASTLPICPVSARVIFASPTRPLSVES